MKNIRRQQQGFTLMELMIAVVILGLIVALVGPAVIGNLGRGQRTAAATQISNFESALDGYRIDVGRYPDSLDGLLENDSGRDSWSGPYLREEAIPVDPWGNPYVYEQEGDDFTLMSYGADGVPGGQDDDADIR